MGKRSEFVRNKHDEYLTPFETALPLKPYLAGVRTFVEPCCANGQLVRWLESFGLACAYSNDIQNGVDAAVDPLLDTTGADAIITNPPYTWTILKLLIERFMRIAPTWLLLEADFAFNLQSAPFMRHCSDVVPIGRVRWFPGTRWDGKDNYAWYRFHIQHTRGPIFHTVQAIDKRAIRRLERPEVEYA